MDTELFGDQLWQMTFGERAAVQGLLSVRKPALAIEIGTADGACLRWIARHAGEVHSFDLIPPSITDLPAHVHLHTGDSHSLLPRVLAQFAAEGRNVDFVLVDGDHSSDGVRHDMLALLTSTAIADTVIVAHDIGNERVRAGLDAVPYGAFAKVAHVDLDFVPGHLGRDCFSGELWSGLGLILVAVGRPAYGSGPAVQTDRHHGGELLVIARDVLGGRPPSAGPIGHDARARQLSDAYRHIDVLEQRVAEADDALSRCAAECTAKVDAGGMINDPTKVPGGRFGASLRAVKRAGALLYRR